MCYSIISVSIVQLSMHHFYLVHVYAIIVLDTESTDSDSGTVFELWSDNAHVGFAA